MTSKFLPESYTPLEEQRIDALRSRLSDLNLGEERLHPSELIRWLRARSLDVGKANEMFRKHLEWRKLSGVDGILEREKLPEDFERIFPMAFVGVDNEGYPILLAPAGRRDVRPILQNWGMERCYQVMIVFGEITMDYLRTVSQEQGRPVTQMIQIVDMDGFNYRQFASKLCRDFTMRNQTAFNDNYPEVLRYAMFINAPKAFHVIWNLFKPFVPKETLDKLEIFGTDKEAWMKAIREKFPLAELPPHWGGNRKGEDEYCSNDKSAWILGTVSKSFFNFSKPYPNDDGDMDCSDLTTKIIGARDSLKIRLSVTSPNSLITWRFRTENHDIGFQVLDEDGTELVAYRKIKCQKDFEEGQQPSQKLGIHTVVFDNSYSWARSKTVQYSVSVIGAEQENGVVEDGSISTFKIEE